MWLVIAGGILQMLGFGFVAWELWRVQAHEFGEPEALRRWRSRNQPERHPKPVTLELAPAEGRSSTRMELTTGPPAVIPVETRLDQVERDIRSLKDKVAKARSATEDALNQVNTKLKTEELERVHEWKSHEKERKAFLKTTVRLQACGAFLFLLGTAMATIGGVL